jgi:hypothetical protein
MPLNTWKVLSAFLAVMLLWVSASLVRVENQRYALTTGMCAPRPPHPVPDMTCLERVETRTGWWWHLYYAMKP